MYEDSEGGHQTLKYTPFAPQTVAHANPVSVYLGPVFECNCVHPQA